MAAHTRKKYQGYWNNIVLHNISGIDSNN